MNKTECENPHYPLYNLSSEFEFTEEPYDMRLHILHSVICKKCHQTIQRIFHNIYLGDIEFNYLRIEDFWEDLRKKDLLPNNSKIISPHPSYELNLIATQKKLKRLESMASIDE